MNDAGIEFSAASTVLEGILTATSGTTAGNIAGTLTVGGNDVATTDANNGVIDLGQLAVTGTMHLTIGSTGNVTIDNGRDIVLSLLELPVGND